ncbi:MAG: hypothetical protein IK058_00425 [Bacteroidales bacterium]|nr:hypothetical protein [Bacteroidales bacterium]
MKKTIVLTLLVALTLPVLAQHDGHRHGKQRRADITELVSDLSAPQKRKIETVNKESRERVDALRASQRAVRDSIALFMDREGDQSRQLYPLFDREAKLQAAVSREMYATKRRIDEILTPAQRRELRAALAAKRK